MSSFASTAIHPRRSFGARAASCRAAIRIIRGSHKPRESEITEICACLEQEVAMLERFLLSPGVAAEIGKLMERTQ